MGSTCGSTKWNSKEIGDEDSLLLASSGEQDPSLWRNVWPKELQCSMLSAQCNTCCGPRIAPLVQCRRSQPLEQQPALHAAAAGVRELWRHRLFTL